MRSYAEEVKLIQSSKGVPAVKILEAIGEMIKSAYKKENGDDENIRVRIDEDQQAVGVYLVKEVVEDPDEVRDDQYYIDLESSRKIKSDIEVGDDLEFEIGLNDFGRRAANVAKNKFYSFLNQSELETIENEFRDKIGEIIGGDLQRRYKGTLYINLGKAEGILPHQEQSPRDKFRVGDRIKSYIKDVSIVKKNVRVLLSRVDTNFIKKIFELEIPEVYDKTIEINGIAREVGKKIKVIVHSKKSNIDPVGACVGMKGVRIQSIVQELNGEMIDVVRWNDDPKILISNLLKPAEISYIYINEEDKKAIAIVPTDQLSLAIGNKGVNAKLAAKASGWNIDIKTEDQYEEIRKLEDTRVKAEEALGLNVVDQAPVVEVEEEIEYEIDSDFVLEDLEFPVAINKKLKANGYDKIEKLVDVDQSELVEKSNLTLKQAEKVISVIQEMIDVVEEEDDQE